MARQERRAIWEAATGSRLQAPGGLLAALLGLARLPPAGPLMVQLLETLATRNHTR